MENKPTSEPKWLKDYTIVLVLGVAYILLFLIFTSTFNLP